MNLTSLSDVLEILKGLDILLIEDGNTENRSNIDKSRKGNIMDCHIEFRNVSYSSSFDFNC